MVMDGILITAAEATKVASKVIRNRLNRVELVLEQCSNEIKLAAKLGSTSTYVTVDNLADELVPVVMAALSEVGFNVSHESGRLKFIETRINISWETHP